MITLVTNLKSRVVCVSTRASFNFGFFKFHRFFLELPCILHDVGFILIILLLTGIVGIFKIFTFFITETIFIGSNRAFLRGLSLSFSSSAIVALLVVRFKAPFFSSFFHKIFAGSNEIQATLVDSGTRYSAE